VEPKRIREKKIMSRNFLHPILCPGQKIYFFFSSKVKEEKARDLLRIVWVGLRDEYVA